MPEFNIDKRFKKNVLLSVLIKGCSIVLALVMVKVYLSYLGNVQYGLWMTISSIASWVAVGDLGIGNGLRNELAKAFAEKDEARQKELINAAAKAMVKLSILLFCIIMIASEVMIRLNVLEEEVRVPLFITNAFMCINFALGIFNSIANAYQYDYLVSGYSLLYMLLNVGVVLVMTWTGMISSLTLFAIVSGVTNTVAHLVLYRILKKRIRFKFAIQKIEDKHLIRSIMNLGTQFFILQICGLILYSTDNVIINKLFGSAEVTKYSVITNIYNTGDGLFSIMLVSLWSAVTYQYSLKNYTWIKNKIKTLLGYWGLYSIGVIGVSILFNWIVKLWLQEEAVYYEPQLVAIFAIYSIAGMFGAIFVNVSNGIGIIKLQMIMCVIESILNIPLSIFLATQFNLGIMGIKIATLICCTGANVIMPIYITRFLQKQNKNQEITNNGIGTAV